VTAVPRLTPRHAGAITALIHDGSGNLVASGDDEGGVMLWDPATGRLIRRLEGGPVAEVADLAFSADGTRVGAVFASGAIRVWNTVTGARRRRQ
jgi:WD40 repeat protein